MSLLHLPLIPLLVSLGSRPIMCLSEKNKVSAHSFPSSEPRVQEQTRQKAHRSDFDLSSCVSCSPAPLVPALILETSRQHHGLSADAIDLCTTAFPSQQPGGLLPEPLQDAKSQRGHGSEALFPLRNGDTCCS